MIATFGVSLAVATALALATPATAAERPPALVLERGAIAESQLVALGRDVVVDGEAKAGVTALDGSARVSGTVDGEVTVMGGDATILSGAVVRGNVHVLGGKLEIGAGARVEGRSVAYPTVTKAWTTLLEGPSLGLPASSPVVLAAKLGLVAAWLAVTIALFAAFPRGLALASDEIRREPLLCFLAGLVGVLAAFLTLILLAKALPAPLSLPLALVVALGAIGARLWGVVALCHALGKVALALAKRQRVPAMHAATAGLLLLALAKFVPYAGVVVWGAASFVGVGATLRTRFGRETRAPLPAELAFTTLSR